MRKHRKLIILTLGIIFNLAIIGYFKYSIFFIQTFTQTGSNFLVTQLILPLGISFFTFQQISYLIDSYRGKVEEYNLLNYSLFVTFFPQLIAGPIVRQDILLKQFSNPRIASIVQNNIASGICVFFIGLFKKAVLADSIAIYANPLFSEAYKGASIGFFEAWLGSLAYTFQLYFDFSGYSDMAIGLGLLLGISLPVNFNSPFKARDISEFWRRWHITLSNFIRDYLYSPITIYLTRYAMNRRISNFNIFLLTVAFPILFTFFWMGLWHGAGWTFILFGLIHGVYLVIHQVWIVVERNLGLTKILSNSLIFRLFALLLTFASVVVSFVMFRAPNVQTAIQIYKGMLGHYGIYLPEKFQDFYSGLSDYVTLKAIEDLPLMGNGSLVGLIELLGLLLIMSLICCLPNVSQASGRLKLITVFLTAYFTVQALVFPKVASQFLYFQF